MYSLFFNSCWYYTVNNAPTISALPAATVDVGASTAAIGFSVNDFETAPADLTVTATASDTVLVPASGLVLGGTGRSRTITVTPAAGLTGSATVTVVVSDGELTNTRTFTLTVAQRSVVIVQSPQEVAVTAFESASFTVVADGLAPLNYQWRRDGEPIAGATAATFTISSVSVSEAGNYDVVVSNAINSVTSSPAALTVAKATATVSLGALTATYDGTPHAVTTGTNPGGLNVSVTYNGSSTPPTDVGTYAVAATVSDGNYQGSATGSLVISSANATITLGQLYQAYDGLPSEVSVATSPAGLAVSLTYAGQTSAPTLPGTYAVVATITDPNYTGTASELLVVSTAALVRHGLSLNGRIIGSLQIASAESVTLNGSANIVGDLLMAGRPSVTVNGNPSYSGMIDASGADSPQTHRVTLNGGSAVDYVVRRVDAAAIPQVAPVAAPSGTRNVSLNNATDMIGDFATLRNLTFNSNAGNRAVPPGRYGSFTVNGSNTLILGEANSASPVVYEFQSLALNGTGKVTLVGPVILRFAQGISLNGSMGAAAHPDWLELQFANGGLTLNSNVQVHGIVLAPLGTVTINGNSLIKGEIMADRLQINGNGVLEQPIY